MGEITIKSLDRPDEVRTFPGMVGHLSQVGAATIGRAVLQPGWRWSTDVGPMAGGTSCQVHHLNLVLSGRIGFRMDSGETVELGVNDLADVPRGHDAWVVGDEPVVLLDLAGNVGAIGRPSDQERVVTTILMSDIVESTAMANRLGDAAWKQLLGDHDRIVRARLERHGGHEVNTTGDGFLATFPSAIAALRCAAGIVEGVAALGLEVRIGVHTGEVELLPDDIRGASVHAAARIMGLAGPSEILASSVARGLVEGSELRFTERGTHEVKGFERPVEVFRLEA